MSDEFNIFISWSGTRSQWVADALRDWLPMVLQSAKPWMSATDIEKGARGLDEVASKLEGMKVGISCLTPENLNSPWILYEAGALSKTINDKTRLCTYLLGGLQFQDVKVPLGLFQATNSDKGDTLRLIKTINAAVSPDPVSEKNLDRLFEATWLQFEHKLKSIPTSEQAIPATRSLEDMVTEILEIARADSNMTKLLQDNIRAIEATLKPMRFASMGRSMDAIDPAPLSSLLHAEPTRIITKELARKALASMKASAKKTENPPQTTKIANNRSTE